MTNLRSIFLITILLALSVSSYGQKIHEEYAGLNGQIKGMSIRYYQLHKGTKKPKYEKQVHFLNNHVSQVTKHKTTKKKVLDSTEKYRFQDNKLIKYEKLDSRNNPINLITYEYKDKQLSKITMNNPKYQSLIEEAFVYNKQGKIIKSLKSTIKKNSSFQTHTNYKYDGNKVIKTIMDPKTKAITGTVIQSLDAKGRVIKEETKNSFSTYSLEFSYDKNDNIVKTKFSSNPDEIVSYKYDKNKNWTKKTTYSISNPENKTVLERTIYYK